MSAKAGDRTETVVSHRLVLSERIRMAVSALVDEYAQDIDNDPHVYSVNIEIRVDPNRQVRAAIFDHRSQMDIRGAAR